jgi:hypothetical protein
MATELLAFTLGPSPKGATSMKILHFSLYASTIAIAAALLAGCGGSGSQTPATPVPPPTQSPGPNSKDLLYISTPGKPHVLVYNYKTHARVGELLYFNQPEGQCVDAAGDVWITDQGLGVVREYAHGATHWMKVLGAKRVGGPIGCSISPSGDLAVSVNGEFGGNILVFKNASGKPTLYANKHCQNPASPGYDDKGNLYLEGYKFIHSYEVGHICELPAGGNALEVVPFEQQNGSGEVQLTGGDSVMWDGRHIVVTQLVEPMRLYITNKLPGGGLKVDSVTRLSDSNCQSGVLTPQVFFVGTKNGPLNHEQATVALAGNTLDLGSCNSHFNAWSYPAGGNEIWSVNVYYAFGESVSLASS